MTQYFIHIGLHKTATTFLQEKVFPKLEGTTFITRPYTQHNHAFNKLQYADDSLYKKEEFLGELEKIRGDRILLSDECFSGKPLTFNYINRSLVARRLRDAMPQATILLFIRGQKDILLSMYNQYVRSGGTKEMEDFFWKGKRNYTLDMYLRNDKKQLRGQETLYYNTNECYIHLDDYLYYEALSLYYEMFGRVEIFLYEDLVYRPEECANRIGDVLGQNRAIPLNFLRQQDKVNKSVEERELNELRFVNTIKSITSKRTFVSMARTTYRYLLKKGSGRKDSMRNRIEKIVGDYYRTNNARIAEEFSIVGIQNYPEYYQI
jgi:hypothetical protein